MMTQATLNHAKRLHAILTSIELLENAGELEAAQALEPARFKRRAALMTAISVDMADYWPGATKSYRTAAAMHKAFNDEKGKRYALAMKAAGTK